MTFASWAAAHRRSILVLVALLALAGGASGLRVPVALFPEVSFPRVSVSIAAGDRPADQMVVVITQPIEQAVRAIPYVANVRSTTSRGSAELSVTFAWGSDMVIALQQVESAISHALAALPPGTSFTARRMDPTVFPVAAYSLTSPSVDQVALRDIARYQLLPLLSSVTGVARIGVLGGALREYQVDVDLARIQAFGLTFADVATALSASNVLQAVGRMEDHYKLYLALSDTALHTADDIRRTIIRSGDNGLVELSDIAEVKAATAPQWLRVTADGRDAVSVQVYQQPGGNTVQIVKDVKARLAQFAPRLPKDVKIGAWYDQSELIVASATSVRDAILVGVGLAALVLLVFLRSLKITLVAILLVPAVLATTVLLLFTLGMSFNIMTLGGMAAAIGLIVDDAIVMIENIVKHLRAGKGEPRALIREGASAFFRPLAASSACTIVIFLPLAFLSGITGAFFQALSLTMASALAVSFLVVWLAVPLLAEHVLGEKDAAREDEGRVQKALARSYRAVMGTALRWPIAVPLVMAALLAAGYLAFNRVGSGFMPPMDEGGFVLDYRSAPGTSLTESDRLLRQVEDILRNTPEVANYSRRTGAQLGGGLTEANSGDFFVRLGPLPRRPIDEVMADIRRRINLDVPGLDIDMGQLMEDLIGDLTAVPQPIEVKLYGDDPQKLFKTAPKVADAIRRIPGVVGVRTGVVLAGDALVIKVDRRKAALVGVNPASATQQVQAFLNGVVTAQIQEGPKLVGVRVWVPAENRAQVSQVRDIPLRSPSGQIFPLSQIATVDTVAGQPQIVRDDLKPMVAVTGRISGRDMGSTVADVVQALKAPGLIDPGTYYDLGGLYRQQQIAFQGLIAVFGAATCLVVLLLLFIYENFRVVLAIMTVPLCAVAAVFVGLWATGVELNITAMMGMTMVVGIVTEVAIFYFSSYEILLASGQSPGVALVEAGVERMRPIAMTTLAAILALLPLALALGEGAAMQQPLAVAIISGLIVQLPLVLLLMPVAFSLLLKLGGRDRQHPEPGGGARPRDDRAPAQNEGALTSPSGSL